jgi:hypothetical protein
VTLTLTLTSQSLEKLALSEASVRWPPACEDVSSGAEERALLEDGTKQRSEDHDWERYSVCDSDL